MGDLPTVAGSVLAAVRAVDVAGLVVLAAFTWWGARKGALRQALSLAVLAGGFLAAHHGAAGFAPTVGRLFDVGPAERLALAWGSVLFGTLVAGALLVRVLAAGLPDRSRPGPDRVVGGLLGVVKGAVLLVIVGYVALAAAPSLGGPSLARREAPPAAEAPQDVSDRVRGSLTATCLVTWSSVLRGWLDLPPWVETRVRAVDRRLGEGSGPPARPTGRSGP